jgi:hypothetical protein
MLWFYSVRFVRCSEFCSLCVSTECNVPREIRRRESESLRLSLKNKPHSRAGMQKHPGRQLAVTTTFYTVANNVYG